VLVGNPFAILTNKDINDQEGGVELPKEHNDKPVGDDDDDPPPLQDMLRSAYFYKAVKREMATC